MRIPDGIRADFFTASLLAAVGSRERAAAVVGELELALALGRMRPAVRA